MSGNVNENREAESTVELLPNGGQSEVKVIQQQKVSPHKTSNLYLKMDAGEEAELTMMVTNLRKIVNVLTAMVVGAVIGIIILIIVFTVLFARLNSDLRTHKHAPRVQTKMDAILSQQELCFKCSELRTGPSWEEGEELKEFRKMTGVEGDEMCCVDTARQLLKQLQMFVERKFWEEVSRGSVKLPGASKDLMTIDRPAALLVGPTTTLGRDRPKGSLFDISEWTTRQDIAFTTKVNYNHGRLVVPAAGYYYVYSQTSFIEQFHPDHTNTPQGRQSQSLSHYIYRYNPKYPKGGEERLLQNSQTKCWSTRISFGEYSSYIGAVLYLRQGDQIYLKVSNLTILSQQPKANYFGLFKL